MDTNFWIDALKIIGGSVNFGLAIKYFFRWIMRNRPIEENIERDKDGNTLNHAKKFR